MDMLLQEYKHFHFKKEKEYETKFRFKFLSQYHINVFKEKKILRSNNFTVKICFNMLMYFTSKSFRIIYFFYEQRVNRQQHCCKFSRVYGQSNQNNLAFSLLNEQKEREIEMYVITLESNLQQPFKSNECEQYYICK